ncbi:hypothetical protein Taro_008784 [Colocasia esculenta]|uniref:Uncharacterized protein n=1 Tax=Colocasia esculenta TaxID=4460 RepID=A0A843TYK2_COLES|nr:hypothetical protein [Colocasia esculenta]
MNLTAYNLLLYMLASHVLGASWYLLSIERQTTCWKSECKKERDFSNATHCLPRYLDCDSSSSASQLWARSTQVFINCNASNGDIAFQFGIFQNALTTGAVSAKFMKKYLYCLWWGLQNLSSLLELVPYRIIQDGLVAAVDRGEGGSLEALLAGVGLAEAPVRGARSIAATEREEGQAVEAGVALPVLSPVPVHRLPSHLVVEWR